jgi:methyl-accepting chemotaxis protein
MTTTKPTTDAQRQEQIEALIDSSHRQAEQIDHLFDVIEALRDRMDTVATMAADADHSARRAADVANDAQYTADEAKRAAENAARSGSRGW